MASLKPVWLSVGSLSERLHRAGSLHLGLDFDGTLAPLDADPRRTALPQRTRDVIERLARRPNAQLAILSSRALDDLFRVELTRRVNPDATIRLARQHWEVDPALVGQQVLVRYRPEPPSQAHYRPLHEPQAAFRPAFPVH